MGSMGIAPDAQGNGLTDLEHRRIIWSQYRTFGIIQGAEVEGTAGMAYRVRPGAVAYETSASNREAIIMPVPSVPSVPTIAAPASGSRTDYVWVDQQGQVFVTQSSSGSGRFLLSQRTVTAGTTATTSTTASRDRDFAVPLAGSLGVIDRWDDDGTHLSAIPTGKQRVKSGRFVLPSDRRMIFDVRHSATSIGHTNPIVTPVNGTPTGAYLYTITIDNVVYKLTFYHARMWETKVDSVDFWATAGSHNWSIDREVWFGAGGLRLGNGSSDIPPTSIKIVDRGATR